MNEERVQSEIGLAISNYCDNIFLELQDRWNNWQFDLTKKEIKEVVCGIISRQVTIITNYSKSPSFWNGDVAPIILRSLADNYINLAWILKDPEERSRKFIFYGLGQAKLNLEHRKKHLEDNGLKPSDDLVIDETERWINTQRYTFLTEVNIGSWSEISIRKMAEDAGCIDFYNFVYQPFSSASHNMWNHISRYNLIYSDNPLHMYLLKPIVREAQPELEYLELGAKYLTKMFKLFDDTFHYKSQLRYSSLELADEINRIEMEIEKSMQSEDRGSIE